MRYTLHVLSLFILLRGLSPILNPDPVEAAIPEEPPSLSGIPSVTGTVNDIVGYDFKVPPGLKPQVDFWKKVFSQYGTYQILIHDKKYVSIVYEVLDLSYLKDKKLPYKKELRHRYAKASECKKKYTSILKKLAANPDVDPAKLEPEERRVYDMFYGINEPDKFAAAAKDKRMRAQVGQKERFIKGIYNWSKYRDRMQEIFTEQGLPTQLTYLPFVESYFTVEAVSCVKAVGIWQFMRYTGRLYLNINNTVDERRDPYKATLAAAKLLRSNYDLLGSWPLAITAYNHGPNGVAKGVKKTGSTELTDLIENYNQKLFGFASQNFYAEFLAVSEIAPNYKSYFGEVEIAKPLQYDTFILPQSMTVSTLTKHCDLTLEDIKGLNPGLNKRVILSKSSIPRGYELNIPLGTKDAVAAKIQRGKSLLASQDIPKPEGDGWYEVIEGDTLGAIARQYRTTVDILADLNDLDDTYRLKIGQKLRLPDAKPAERVKVIQIVKADESSQKQTDPVPGGRHRVAKGETLWKISQRYNTTVEVLKELNGLKNTCINVGQEICLPSGDSNQVAETEYRKINEAAESPKTESPQENRAIVSVSPNYSRKVEADIFATNFMAADDPKKVPLRLTQAQSDASHEIDNAGLKVQGEGNIVKIAVAQGETIGLYADWCGVSTSHIRQTNGWRKSRSLAVGQTVKMDVSRVGRDAFESKRLAFHNEIQQKYLSSYRIERIQTHILEPNQSLWYLCQYVYKIPLWLVEMYNKGRDLTQLIPGDQLYIPIVTQKL